MGRRELLPTRGVDGEEANNKKDFRNVLLKLNGASERERERGIFVIATLYK
jgi:hypothetical protein